MNTAQDEPGAATTVRARRLEPPPAGEDGPVIVPRGAGLSRLVLWAGVMAGTALVVLAEWHGVHPRIPGLPGWLGYVAGFAAAWLVMAGLSVWAASLLRTHHRAMAGWMWRAGRRAAVAGYQAGRGQTARISDRAAERWRERGDTWRAPLIITRRERDDAPGPVPGEPEPRDAPAVSGEPEGQLLPALVPVPAAARAAAGPDRTGGSTMHDAPPRDLRAAPGAAPSGVPAHWKGLAAATADFHPDSDADLLEWMSSEVAGMLAYGEAVAEVHEHCLTAVRADPAAMAALHDVADAAADCAEAMARAMAKFREIYEAPREFVNEGGVLPKDGDWLQGDEA